MQKNSIIKSFKFLLDTAYSVSVLLGLLTFYYVFQIDNLASWKKFIQAQSLRLQEINDFVNQRKNKLQKNLERIMQEKQTDTWESEISILLKSKLDPEFSLLTNGRQLIKIDESVKNYDSVKLDYLLLTRMNLIAFNRLKPSGIPFVANLPTIHEKFIFSTGTFDFFKDYKLQEVRLFSANKEFLKSIPVVSTFEQLLVYLSKLGNESVYFNFFAASKAGKSEFWGSSHQSEVLCKSRITLVEPQRNYLSDFESRWKVYLILFIVTFIIFGWVRVRFTEDLKDSLNRCISYSIETDNVQTKSLDKVDDEIDWLYSRMCILEDRISQKWMILRLSLGLQTILNKSQRSLDYYLEEADYFLRDLQENFRVYYHDEPLENPSGLVIQLSLNEDQKDFLNRNIRQKPNFFLHFPHLSQSEDDLVYIIHERYLQMIEKARLENFRLKQIAIKSDLDLANRIQQILMPKNKIDTIEGWQIGFSNEASRGTTGEFLDIFESENYLHFYLVDLFESGIRASLMAMVYKSFLDLKILERKRPSEILNELQTFLCEQKYDDAPGNLFLGFLNIRTGKLDYVSAGVGMAFHIRGKTHERLEAENPPVCSDFNTVIHSNSLILDRNEVLYLVSAEAELQSLSTNTKFEFSDLISILYQHESISLNQLINEVDLSIQKGSNQAREGLRLLQLAVKRC